MQAMVNRQFVALTGCTLDQVRVPGVLRELVKVKSKLALGVVHMAGNCHRTNMILPYAN